MTTQKHDQILIEGLNEGNERIFDYLFHLYYSGLVVYAKKFLSVQTEAEDIVQEIFVNLWIHRASFSIDQSIKAYLFTAIKNRCIDNLRHQAVTSKAEKILAERMEISYNEDHLLIESELRGLINAAIQKLPSVCREIFIMNRFEGLKPSEIAEKKGISIRTVEGHIGKALKIMRKELETYLPTSLVTVLLNIFYPV
jgi:RNA polymerase sigma-70 factor, ECF subfamily